MRLRNNPKALDILNENPDLVVMNPEEYKGKWKQLFGNDNPLYIEVGMGKGDFIYENARRYPKMNFIGIERYPSVLAAAVNKLNQMDHLDNLRLIKFDATLLEEIFAPKEVDKLFLNFSDPWPKNRHAKRRLTSPTFLKIYQGILGDDAVIEFKTDNQGLFEYSLMTFNEYPVKLEYVSLDLHRSPENEDNIQTEYEVKFSVHGPIYKAIVRY